MHQIKHNLDEIIKHGSSDDMHRLTDLFIDAYASTDDHTKKHIYAHLHRLAHGNHLSRDMADEWTSHMTNKDGTTGPHWSYEQASAYADNHDKNDFYAVLNMMWSDYYNPTFSQTQYISLAKDFLDDKDAPEDKILRYYCEIAKKW